MSLRNNNSEIRIRGGFAPIHLPSFRPEVQKKGVEMIDHVSNVEEIRTENMVAIKGLVLRGASIRENPYTVSFEIERESRILKDGHCSCVAGITATCKHSAALTHYVNNERTLGKTDKAQEWSAPSKLSQLLYPKGETIEKLYNFPSSELPHIVQVEDPDSCLTLAKQLKEAGLEDSSLFKSLTVEKEQEVTEDQGFFMNEKVKMMLEQPAISFTKGENAKISLEEKGFYDKFVVIDEDERIAIFSSTIGQSLNHNWFKFKRNRLSASKLHKIVHARKSHTALKYFFEIINDNKNLQYGRDLEAKAREKYIKVTSNTVYESGLVTKKGEPWICASPDGIVVDTNGNIRLLEIKCPISCKDSNINVPYIVNGELKKSHAYYSQVMIQLYCCDLRECDFFVFSEKDFVKITVIRDDKFL